MMWRSSSPAWLLTFCWLAFAPLGRSCELCAVYNASSARAELQAGFVFSISEQFIPYRTLQVEGEEVHTRDPDFRDTSITHLVPSYNFSQSFGVSLNVPIIYHHFKRSEVRYSRTTLPEFRTEKDDTIDLGDAALIARWTALNKAEMDYGLTLNLLAGVKFPTGDTDRIKDEIAQTRIFDSLLPPNTPHDPLGHSVSGIHQHDLSPGSGSFDGIFGLTLNTRWRQFFFNSQFQYYLRTEGESEFRYGDELIVAGGPGAFVVSQGRFTLSVQANASYETRARDQVEGRLSDRTGTTSWYVGPQLFLTWRERLSANAGVDFPVRIGNNGYQNVADYRIHFGLSWRL